MTADKKIRKPDGEAYSTDDKIMFTLLLCSGFYPTGHTASGKELTFHFEMNEVWCLVEDALNGKTDQLVFKFSELFRAETTWKMALRHAAKHNHV